jgi:hypothetical protein
VVSKPVQPNLAGIVATNSIQTVSGEKTGMKLAGYAPTQTAGARVLSPDAKVATGTAAPKANGTAPKINVGGVNAALTGAPLLNIHKGQRLPDIGTFTIVLNSKMLDFDVNPKVVNGVPLAPIRHLIEQYGGEVSWEHATKIVKALAEGKSIRIKIGDRIALVDDNPYELEVIPYIESGRTIVPLSFVKDTLNVQVQYDPATGHVLITSVK